MLYTTIDAEIFHVNGVGVGTINPLLVPVEIVSFYDSGLAAISPIEPAVVFWKSPVRYDRHKIGGTVSVDGVAGQKTVVALDRRTFTLITATTSDPVTGEWVMQGLQEYPEESLMVLAIDDADADYNAEVADFITQVATHFETVGEAVTE